MNYDNTLTPQMNYDNLSPVLSIDAETPIVNMKPLKNDHVYRKLPEKVKFDQEMKNNLTKPGAFDFAKLAESNSSEFQAILEEVGIK